ncbi:MAG TPA: iron-sulfur cluster repair di-iron protein [Thermoanaerobaculia bacterium]|nr:iron-sulfur cluster repair di-iron protein [Thermoanaerobaculia bacterium]
MDITPDTHVAKIATRHPGTIRVFQRHGIDFCCGGKRPLADASAEQGLDLEALRRELAAAAAGPEADERDWDEAPLAELVDHIVTRFHDRLREELPRLAAMADRVLTVHGEKHPDVLPALARTFHGLRAELESHTMKEEQILFPWICEMERGATGGASRGCGVAGLPGGAGVPGASVEGPIAVMEAEHDDAARALAELRRLTGGFQPPTGACTTFRGLYHGLAELEADTHRHIHLENNVLFPRAQELEAEVTGIPA